VQPVQIIKGDNINTRTRSGYYDRVPRMSSSYRASKQDGMVSFQTWESVGKAEGELLFAEGGGDAGEPRGR